MLPLGVSAVTLGFGFLITLDRAAAGPARLAAAGADRAGAGRAAARGAHARAGAAPASTTGSGRPPRRWAPGRCGSLLTVDLPVLWQPLLAGSRVRVRGLAGRVRRDVFLARDGRPTLPVVIFRLIGRPGRAELRHGAGRLGRARRGHRRW